MGRLDAEDKFGTFEQPGNHEIFALVVVVDQWTSEPNDPGSNSPLR